MREGQVRGNSDVSSLRIRRYTLILALGWTSLAVASLVWCLGRFEEHTLETARIQARTAYERDVIFRRWNARQGGVYAPTSEGLPPNPFLAQVPERDLTTPSGRRLTLVNPAYMTRQVHELARQEYGIRSHITSLKPIRPENAPDAWEREALEAFQRG